MIQIDMDIPKTCDDCPFHRYHSGKNYVCVATPLFYPMNLTNYKDGRKDFCPLKEASQEPILDKVKEVVAKWKVDNFTDGYAWDCMKEIANIVNKAESEDT